MYLWMFFKNIIISVIFMFALYEKIQNFTDPV